jgi:hypothetical protein
MAQAVLDICYGLTLIEEIYCPGMPETMDRIDVFKPLGRKGLFEILPADAVDAMTGEFFSPLIDKEPVLIWGLWRDTIFSDIELKEMRGLWFKLYKPELISLSQDGQSHFLRVKVVQIQRCHFGGSGTGVIEQMKERIIPEPLLRPQVNGVKDLQDLILIKKTDEGFLSPFLGDAEDDICHLLLFRIFEADHFGKRLEGCKPMIAGLDQVLSLTLKVFKKSNN